MTAANALPVVDLTAPSLDAESGRDGLTGLLGLDAARARLAHWLQEPEEGTSPMVHALLLGLRRFETINLAYGEAAGDGVLVEVADRITRLAGDQIEGVWALARGAGGTFLLIAKEACSRERWQWFAEQLADGVASPITRRAGTVRLTPRLSLLRVLGEDTVESVLDRLAQTLAQAKRNPARRLIWADGETSPAGRTSGQLEADLMHAIDQGEIEVVFQPQFALDSAHDGAGERLSGAEALARWNHPTLGRIGAGGLFAVAEAADYTVPLSRHIAESALKAAAAWPDDLRLSLNVTAADLADGGFAEGLEQVLADTGFARERLTLEVTEQVLVADMQLAERSLAALAAQGIRIALDDFGAGFCNFRYLKVLPLHYLKLDRAMVEGITEDPRDLAVLRGILAMAGALDLSVIAEGIETEAQLAAIRAEGCACYQGFLRAGAMDAQLFLLFTRDQN